MAEKSGTDGISDGISRRGFLKGTAATASAVALAACTDAGGAGSNTSAASAADPGVSTLGARTVDHLWDSFFDIPMPRDPWEQRQHVGYLKVRRFTYPQLHEQTSVPGPDLYPNIAAHTYLYTTGRWKVAARNLPDLTIDTIGGVNSSASDDRKRGFLPRNLMGDLPTPAPAGGNARLQAHVQFISRPRAYELAYPQQFGYHGVEEETNATITMDRKAAQKILGMPDMAPDAVESWWKDNKTKAEQAWWWWLFDEGGDVQVGGKGRLDVRYAFDTPLQMWDNSLDLAYEPATEEFILTWDWVSMAGSMLFSRWITEGLGLANRFETNSPSDIHLDLKVGPDASDMDLDTGVDYALYKYLGVSHQWVFEPALGDVPNLAREYFDGSIYQSPAGPYANKTLGGVNFFDYQPSSWDLLEGETLTIDLSGIAKRKGLKIGVPSLEPDAKSFPGRIQQDSGRIRYEGPIDFTSWSKENHPKAWAKLADEGHPDGLVPWGEPFITFKVTPDAKLERDFRPVRQFPKVSSKDHDFDLPAFPKASLEPVPALAAAAGTGRSLRFDYYNFLDVPMARDRWDEYAANNYQHVQSMTFPVSYKTTPYFPPVQPPKPFSDLASGLRLKATGRKLPEITIDRVNGFLPRNLMYAMPPGEAPSGGTARLEGHMRYGTRSREMLYRQQPYWGFYGWENYLDARITMDRIGTEKILGITDAQFDDFPKWFAENVDAVRYAWRMWLYEEWRRNNAMDFFNFPLQIWGFPLELEHASADQVVLKQTILNEALDVLYGKWFNNTFMPSWQGSYDDLFIDLRIGPDSSDLDLDTVNDWGLSASGSKRKRSWAFESYIGSNPYLAHEYRMKDAPGLPYFGQNYTYTPTLWNLAAGEQLNFHFASSDLGLVSLDPTPEDFPGVVDVAPGRVSITGPVDLEPWSRETYPDEWDKTGGLLPFGAPYLVVS